MEVGARFRAKRSQEDRAKQSQIWTTPPPQGIRAKQSHL
jgi:hypothetical protein